MRSTLIVSAFAALALAAPRPQDIDFSGVDATPDPIPTAAPVTGTSQVVPDQPAAAAAAAGTAAVDGVTTTSKRRSLVGKRDGNCAAQPAGTGPAVNSPDTPQAFLDYPDFHAKAQYYAVDPNVPQGYTLAFSDLEASSQTTSYRGYKTLASYDPVACQQYCDADAKCTAFNIYYERDPTQNPNTANCPNPTSLTNIKCVKWGVQVTKATATNSGQYRDSFQVVISGSNGYNKIAGPPTQEDYNAPVPLGGAINAPLDPTNKLDTYMRQYYFNLGTDVLTYNDGVVACIAAAKQSTAYNKLYNDDRKITTNPQVSNQVVTYVLSKNNIPQGVQCATYTESWAPNYATNVGQYRGNNAGGSDYYSVTQAYSHVLTSYASKYADICAVGGCPSGSFRGGNCGGFGAGTC